MQPPAAVLEGERQAGRRDRHDVDLGEAEGLAEAVVEVELLDVRADRADVGEEPAELPRLIQPILEDKADAVFGSRFLGGEHRVLYFWHRMGNGALTLLSNMFTDLNLTDMETCYKMVRADLMKSLPLRTNRFGIEPELTARLAQARARIWELPISYDGRTYAEGKKIGWRDGVAALWHIVRANVFAPPVPQYAPGVTAPVRQAVSAGRVAE